MHVSVVLWPHTDTHTHRHIHRSMETALTRLFGVLGWVCFLYRRAAMMTFLTQHSTVPGLVAGAMQAMGALPSAAQWLTLAGPAVAGTSSAAEVGLLQRVPNDAAAVAAFMDDAALRYNRSVSLRPCVDGADMPPGDLFLLHNVFPQQLEGAVGCAAVAARRAALLELNQGAVGSPCGGGAV